VLLATVNEPAMVPFVSQQLNNLDLALALAKRGNLPGAEGLVLQQFERLFGTGQYKEAAECAAESPQVRCGLAGALLVVPALEHLLPHEQTRSCYSTAAVQGGSRVRSRVATGALQSAQHRHLDSCKIWAASSAAAPAAIAYQQHV
jgi:hypothetical protein